MVAKKNDVRQGWAVSTLLESGAIHKCSYQGHYQEHSDPEARRRAIDAAREDPMEGLTADDAVAAVKDVLARLAKLVPTAAEAFGDRSPRAI